MTKFVVRDDIITAESENALRRDVRGLQNQVFGTFGTGLFVPASLVAFRYKGTSGDVIVARRIIYPAGTEASVDSHIAKPYLHRPSITTRGDHTYTYTSDYERIDDLLGNLETQELTPSYEVNDLVYAARVVGYTGVEFDAGAGLAPVQWLQMNIDGRAWAAVTP